MVYVRRTVKNIVLGVSGSIAAYKAADLSSQLTQKDYNVSVVMTADATSFIGPLTLQTLSRNPVLTSLADEKDSWQPGHIKLADDADLFLAAPATANVIAKMAAGIADDAFGAIALATRAPVIVAPAMNGRMWSHPATQKNVATLQGWDIQFVGPDSGLLACGYEGAGRLASVDDILNAVDALFSNHPGKRKL